MALASPAPLPFLLSCHFQNPSSSLLTASLFTFLLSASLELALRIRSQEIGWPFFFPFAAPRCTHQLRCIHCTLHTRRLSCYRVCFRRSTGANEPSRAQRGVRKTSEREHSSVRVEQTAVCFKVTRQRLWSAKAQTAHPTEQVLRAQSLLRVPNERLGKRDFVAPSPGMVSLAARAFLARSMRNATPPFPTSLAGLLADLDLATISRSKRQAEPSNEVPSQTALQTLCAGVDRVDRRAYAIERSAGAGREQQVRGSREKRQKRGTELHPRERQIDPKERKMRGQGM